MELTIPMPGHNANGALLEKAKSSFVQLEELIADSNVIFLLMDSRESRWLPTALAALNPVHSNLKPSQSLQFKLKN